MRKHYHLIGIGGIGMGALASLLLAKGHKVSGSDLKASGLTGRLKKNGAEITIGHHAGNVRGPDFVVYSSAVPITNPELIASVSRGIPL
ncbi:MAG: UDP-N-acetylmuramate--L-alanine ligase, partial [Candidatus Omnitrophica bacterium]|nr:UDP-N-acetylmuramate--L-alanine ligase [Candidatus Omnitrophota bacterium]